MYGFNEDTTVGTGSSILPAGINEDVTLDYVKLEVMKEGNPAVLQIGFKGDGGTFNAIMWPVDPDRTPFTPGRTHKRDIPALGISKNSPVTREDAVKLAYDNFNTKLKHIATKFVSEEEAIINARSYEEFATKYVALLNKPQFKSIPLRLKLTLNNKDYVQIPLFPPFIELMDTPIEKSQLKITQYDKVVPTAVEAAPPVSNPTADMFSTEEVF
jgi:hypothetical protein